jgi:membrane protease YdiL (CAAX protease family)
MNHAGKLYQASTREIPSAVLVTAGVCIFGWLIHGGYWQRIISFSGLALAAVVIGGSVQHVGALLRVFGLIPFSRKWLPYSVAGIIFGMLLGILYNSLRTDALLPAKLTGFGFLAPLIGITEELLFRGFVQSRLLASLGSTASVLMTAAGHTLYKSLVIGTVNADLHIHLPSLIVLTFLVGSVLGFMRNSAGSIIPPALAHACFDILVYGGAAVAPVWVWG